MINNNTLFSGKKIKNKQ